MPLDIYTVVARRLGYSREFVKQQVTLLHYGGRYTYVGQCIDEAITEVLKSNKELIKWL